MRPPCKARLTVHECAESNLSAARTPRALRGWAAELVTGLGWLALSMYGAATGGSDSLLI